MGKRKASQTAKQILSTSDSDTEHKKVRKKGKFKCKICDKIFTEKSNLRSHEYVHTSDTPFACPYAPECGYRGKTKKYLARHVKNNHRDMTNEHKCDVCGKLFHHASGLKVHAMVHTGEKPHSCNVCGKTFRVTYTLNTHMLTHTNEKPFQCSFCDYACRDSSTLRKHQNKHMGLQSIYECKICDKGYKNRSSLKLHLAEVHLKENVRIYPCDQCGRTFKKKCQRRLHIRSFHERALSCTCPVCGRTIASRLQLSTHLRTHLSERPFACTHEGCGLAFKTKSSLTKHCAIHDPSLHHACSYCGRKFVRKTHAQRHERVMHRDRNRGVECHYCGARFYSKNYLLKHIQIKHIHKNRFKFICDVCGLTTHNKPSIVMHLKYGHSNDNDMQCKLCNGKKVYKRHMYLKQHYWKTHNIRYKINRKPTNKPKKENVETGVEIKVEPVDAESYEEIQLLDVKEEDEDYAESTEYSSRVLTEDVAASILETRNRSKGRNVKEIHFDDFFVRNVYPKQEEKQQMDINAGVNEEQNEIVKLKIKQILIRSKKREEAKALKRKLIQEEKDRIQRELEEAQMQAEKERQEILELRRVREMYNEIMKAALTKERERKSKGKDQVKIKFFKKKPEEASKLDNVANINELEHSKDDNNSEDEHNNSISSDTIVNNKDTLNNMELDALDNTASLNKDNTVSDISNVNDTIDNDNNNTSVDANITSQNYDIRVNLSKDAVTSENVNYELSLTSYEQLTIACNDKEEMVKDDTDKNNREIGNNEASHDNEDEAMDMDTVLSDTFFDSHEGNNLNGHNITTKGGDKNCTIQENITNNIRETIDNKSDLVNTQNNDEEVLNVNTMVTNEIHANKNDLPEIHNITNNTDNANKIQEHGKNKENTVTQETGNGEDLQDFNRNNDSLGNTANDTKKQISHAINDETEYSNHEDEMNYEYLDIPLSERIVKKRKRKKQYEEDKSWSDEEGLNEEISVEKTKKMEFKSYQCYVCFKLYQTKPELIDHCQEHFEVCNERTLTKCPICNHISYKSIASHMKIKHKLTVKIPFNQIKDRNTGYGSKYCYDVNGTDYEVIPSVKILNKTASDNIDRKRREANDKIIAKPKLVRKGNEWIVEKEVVDIKYDEIPELTDRELHKCKLTDNDVDRLGQLSYLAKKKGLKMMFPCFKCDKICLNFSALKLHKRRHEDNPKPFKPKTNKRNKEKQKTEEPKKVKLDKSNRTAMPRPIKNKHKCDAALIDFYEKNIRGGDIEFWQFLKIFNRMDKEQVNDFEDLEARSDFGNHLDYYKDVADEIADENEVAGEIDEMADENEVASDIDEMADDDEIARKIDESEVAREKDNMAVKNEVAGEIDEIADEN